MPKVQLVLATTAVTTHEGLLGVVLIRTSRPVAIRSVSVFVSGVCSSADVTQTFFEETVYVEGDASGTSIVESGPGKKVCRFSMSLPARLQTSVVAPGSLLVRFTARATAVTSNGTVSSDEVPFAVVANEADAGSLPREALSETHLRIEGVNYEFTMQKVCRIGEEVSARLVVNNETAKPLKLKYLLIGEHEQQESAISGLTVDYGGVALGEVGVQSSVDKTVKITWPQKTMPSTRVGIQSWRHYIVLLLVRANAPPMTITRIPITVVSPNDTDPAALVVLAKSMNFSFEMTQQFRPYSTILKYRRDEELPPGWERSSSNGRLLYLDHITRTCSATPGGRPCSDPYPLARSVFLPPGWSVASEKSETFFINHIDGAITFNDPRTPGDAEDMSKMALDITVMRAERISDKEITSYCSVNDWANLSWPKKSPQKIKTSSKKGTSPDWVGDSRASLRLKEGLDKRKNVVVFLWESGSISDKCVGWTTIDLSLLPVSTPVVEWFKMAYGRGSIMLKLELHDSTQSASTGNMTFPRNWNNESVLSEASQPLGMASDGSSPYGSPYTSPIGSYPSPGRRVLEQAL